MTTEHEVPLQPRVCRFETPEGRTWYGLMPVAFEGAYPIGFASAEPLVALDAAQLPEGHSEGLVLAEVEQKLREMAHQITVTADKVGAQCRDGVRILVEADFKAATVLASHPIVLSEDDGHAD